MLVQLVPVKHEITDVSCIRRCKIKRINDGKLEEETELWFELDKTVSVPEYDDCDAYLLAMLMDAMVENRRIEICGKVSKQLLSNLVEFQAAWNKCLPQQYFQVDITAEHIIDDSPSRPKNGAVCAFSGGVDATFSVWRHSQLKVSHRSQNINLCVLVHGFDIPLDNETDFISAKERSQKTLDDVGIELKSIKTNFREISKVDWLESFCCALVATLSNFKNDAGTCIIGSCEPYDHLVFPLGSSPITDYLLSSNEFSVMHDGASHNRTDKVKVISEWQAGLEHLRVCWKGDLKDRNCGVCEKCVRTQLNFLAVNAPIPSSFPESNIIDNLKQVKINNDAVMAEWRQLHVFVKAQGIDAPWVNELAHLLREKNVIEKLFSKEGAIGWVLIRIKWRMKKIPYFRNKQGI